MTIANRYLVVAIVFAASVAACGGYKNPTTPTAAATRIMRIDGTLNFGDVPVGQSSEQVLRLFNDGNATLTVASVQLPAGGTYAATWAGGPIAPGTSQPVTVRFTPAAVQNYGGVLTIGADNTGGTNQLTIVARGV